MSDYSKSIIYKLQCKDPQVSEIYIGATTNFTSRKCKHKKACINENREKYNYYVYRFIRAHGNWENWEMIVVEKVNARDKRHLNQIESKYIRELKAKLNSIIPQDIEAGLEMKEWHKQYYKNNHERLSEYFKKYRKNNNEQIRKKWKEMYKKNREIISEKTKVKVKCHCGSQVRKSDISKHRKTKKHKDWVNLPEPNLVFVD